MTDDQSTSQEVTATEPTTPQESEVIHKPAPVVEFEPPLACVRRILKNSLPATANVGKDAAAAFSRAAGIFIIYVTACANDFAREHKRQTITAADVLAAIKVRELQTLHVLLLACSGRFYQIRTQDSSVMKVL